MKSQESLLGSLTEFVREFRAVPVYRGTMLALSATLLFSAPARADFETEFKAAMVSWNRGDMVTAMSQLRGPADAGHAPSQVLLAYILDKSEFNEEAVAYYKKAVAQGSAEAQFDLGALYAAGEGVQKDEVEARRLMSLAANQGHVGAINALAQAYLTGGLALDAQAKESPQALAMIEKAAAGNYLAAIDALSAAYVSGRWGLAPNTEMASKYRAQANKLRGITETGKKKGR